ncbi:MAG TPA: hypothetical protein VMH28_00560 [Candidatus Acidoferrales bacterium]|nr:hypothetical protein [Candidatus Acidoferrales bacterium]
MKSTTKLMITAAVLTIATGVASAQSLRAEIPFAFRAGDKVMAPGTYQVTTSAQRQYVIISNFENKQSVVVLAAGKATPPKAWEAAGNPMMTFECASRCELTRLWTGPGYDALGFHRHGAAPTEQALVTEIRLSRASD